MRIQHHNDGTDFEVVLVQRNFVHKRTFVKQPIITFSSDKTHDTYWVQSWIENIFSDWLSTQLPDVKDQWKHLHINSDGASAHFKSRFSLQHMCQMQKLFEKRFQRITWLFGCPGHGKGTWDGLGGTIKTTVCNAILKNEEVFADSEEGGKALYEWAKILLMNKIWNPRNVTRQWDIRWLDTVTTRPEKTRVKHHKKGEDTCIYDRDDVEQVTTTAFGKALGLHELFELSMIPCPDNPHLKIRVRRNGCGCSVNLQGKVTSACLCDASDTISINTIPPHPTVKEVMGAEVVATAAAVAAMGAAAVGVFAGAAIGAVGAAIGSAVGTTESAPERMQKPSRKRSRVTAFPGDSAAATGSEDGTPTVASVTPMGVTSTSSIPPTQHRPTWFQWLSPPK